MMADAISTLDERMARIEKLAQPQLMPASPGLPGAVMNAAPSQPIDYWRQHETRITSYMKEFRGVRDRWFQLREEVQKVNLLDPENQQLLYALENSTSHMLGLMKAIIDYLSGRSIF